MIFQALESLRPQQPPWPQWHDYLVDPKRPPGFFSLFYILIFIYFFKCETIVHWVPQFNMHNKSVLARVINICNWVEFILYDFKLRRITTFILCSKSPPNLDHFCSTRFQIKGLLELIATPSVGIVHQSDCTWLCLNWINLVVSSAYVSLKIK